MPPRRDAVLPSFDDFKANSLRGHAGFFRVGQTRGGPWWLVDPHDRAFFSRGVSGVNRNGRADGRAVTPGPYAAAVAALPGAEDPQAFVRSAVQRLRSWHMNTLGPGAGPEFFDRGFYYTETLDFRKVGPAIHLGDAYLPDVFDPAWRQAADAWAREICEPRRDSRELIGYFTDFELGWAQPLAERFPASYRGDGGLPLPPERPSLLQICLSLEPSLRAYHAAWEFVLAPRQGDLDQLARDWRLDSPNKEALRQLTQAETPLQTEGYLRDQKRFTREFSRRYFSTCAALIRTHDPNHLILGCRFDGLPGRGVLAECVYPHVDVLSFHGRPEGLEKWVAACHSSNGMPILIDGFSWADEAFVKTPRKRETRRLTSVERMLSKGRLLLESLVEHRAVVGYAWSDWADSEDAQPPFGRGLVHLDDREAREHTELLLEVNQRAESQRARAN
jgi:hypothetical protein